jgi:hypothetical protein
MPAVFLSKLTQSLPELPRCSVKLTAFAAGDRVVIQRNTEVYTFWENGKAGVGNVVQRFAPGFPAHIARQADLDSISCGKATVETTITAIEAKKNRSLKCWSI